MNSLITTFPSNRYEKFTARDSKAMYAGNKDEKDSEGEEGGVGKSTVKCDKPKCKKKKR